jgi:20S proteasome subunit beta 7
MNDHTKHTVNPVSVGSSVIGIKYNNGIIIASDNRINCYGYKKFTDISRISRISESTIIGSSGEFSDFQQLEKQLVELSLDDELFNGIDKFFGPEEYANYLSYIAYEKRNKMNPYWNTTIIGGFNKLNKPILNSVDQFGTKYTGNYLVSGFGLYFAGPIIDKYFEKKSELTKEEAFTAIKEVFKVLFYRDANAGDRIYYGLLENTNTGLNYSLLEEKLKTNWEHDLFKKSHNEKYHPIA